MNKTVIAVIGILSVACLLSQYIWLSHNRYYIVRGSEGMTYEVDRRTGESWLLYGVRKIPQTGRVESHHHDEQLIPQDEASRITGKASVGNGYFEGKIYNGSDWTVTWLIFGVSAKEKDGSIRWTRDYSLNMSVRPLTSKGFSLTVAGDEGITETPWVIKQAFGYKD